MRKTNSINQFRQTQQNPTTTGHPPGHQNTQRTIIKKLLQLYWSAKADVLSYSQQIMTYMTLWFGQQIYLQHLDARMSWLRIREMVTNLITSCKEETCRSKKIYIHYPGHTDHADLVSQSLVYHSSMKAIASCILQASPTALASSTPPA